ncbi:30S ribosomal protein S14 [Methanoplanus sp. FWC-SCC4]|uniref:Small ribosomal subunit protein uS14 n=1 Tax=Methanochimaera problematica TaxID=2609417 RepID=A0AA97FAP6_9EURY|nr:30S ribosomal protein S14 [Methanoplanus sp. FWC-SCC4]WOF15504.1 30S ribosomal protein S14 [Methanoplanus sp. FWC-SCC4]
MAEKNSNEQEAPAKIFGRGANECQMCGRKQGLVRRYNIMLCRQCFRESAPKIGFKKMN